jgi:hypothetical protein
MHGATIKTNRADGSMLTNIRGRAVSYAAMQCRDQLSNKLTGKSKSKIRLSLPCLRLERGMEVQLHLFLTSALDGAECSTSRLGRIPPGK